MKNTILRHSLLFLFCLFTSDFLLQAQAPQGIPYQAIARNASGVAIANTAVRVRFSIRDSIATGTIRYQETHNPTTSALGLFSVNVGRGTVMSGTFSGINWGRNAKFLQVELDPAGGTAYTDLGTTQMMSVPYALNAGNGLSSGTATNQMMYWNGSAWVTLNPGSNGQTLTICNGVLTWTTGGVCPGTITALNCAGATNSGTLISGTAASGVNSSVPYTGGNGGTYTSQSVSSTGVTGLTATLAAGTLLSGAGSVSYTITGTPATSGSASFALSLGGQTCTLIRTVNPPAGNNPTDADGNTYTTVTIGTQVWMKENLKVSKYRNGDPIPTNLTDAAWQASTSGAFAIYNNDAANNTTYGKLYNWYAVSDSRNLCPVGWHVPSDAEWKTLEISLGMSASDADLSGVRGSAQNVGGKLKSTSTLWNAPNTGATNESGFSGLPGRNRGSNGTYGNVGNYGFWWSSTEDSTALAWGRDLNYSDGSSYRDNYNKRNGFSVRCLRD